MSFNKGKQLKLPQSAVEFLGFEDRLSEISREFREIRDLMKKADRATVDLKTGTFDYHLKELESIVKKLRGEAESQIARPAARKLISSLPDKSKRPAKNH